jgi:hypothetical protein
MVVAGQVFDRLRAVVRTRAIEKVWGFAVKSGRRYMPLELRQAQRRVPVLLGLDTPFARLSEAGR